MKNRSILHPICPIRLSRRMWPSRVHSIEQQEIMRSVMEVPETYVGAANKMGKDFIAAEICIVVFCAAISLNKSCRIVTTSVKEDHLDVLWGEIGRAVITSEVPLLASKGGPLVMNSMEIRRVGEMNSKNPYNYLKGMVAGGDMDALAGHHADITLFVGDECSGLHDQVYEKSQGWAKRKLFFGNTNPCRNFFRRALDEGDLWVDDVVSMAGVKAMIVEGAN